MANTSNIQRIQVTVDYAGQRLDNYLLRQLKGVPKSHIYRIIRKGEVRINRGRARPETRLEAGDEIRIPPIRTTPQNDRQVIKGNIDWTNSILYEDEAVLVINKPAGWAVHAGSGIRVGIIEQLRADRSDRFLELVHRLDRQTSGCLLFARKRASLLKLHEDFRQNSAKQHRINKHYLALVAGAWSDEIQDVELPLIKNTLRSGERMVVVDHQGQYARSRFKIIQRYQNATLLGVTLFTGRTHQIRVHSAYYDHPIVGDEKYGNSHANSRFKKLGLRHLFLHADTIRFTHPVTDKKITVSAPLPLHLSSLLQNESL